MSPPESHQLCGTVPATLGHQIRARAAETKQTTSATVAELLALGMDALHRPEVQLADELQQLRRTTATLGRLGGVMSTATGCWWSESIEGLPRPALLDPSDLMAMPGALLLVGGEASLVVDLEAGRILAIDPAAGDVTVETDAAGLLRSAARALPALVSLAYGDGPGAIELGNGLVIERLPNDRVKVSINGIGPVVDAAVGWKWAVEIGALAVRGVNASANRRVALERALEEVAP